MPVGLALLALLALVAYAAVARTPLGDLFKWCWPLGVLAALLLLATFLPWVWSNLKARMPWLYFKR